MGTGQSENRLLASLPRSVFTRLVVKMDRVALAVKDNLYRAGGPMPFVYFPGAGGA